MSADFLHNHPQFADLIRIVAEARGIDPALIEKDYWLMHCLFGIQQSGMTFELKGGTSLSKGFRIIDRFSEDIDIRIEPPTGQDVKTGRNQTKPTHIESRRKFYDWLADTIRIDGIEKIERDTVFDNATLMSGGIRLYYKPGSRSLDGLKPGILLELGFDDVTPNSKQDITSWLYEYAADKTPIIDNRAKGVDCYDPSYTFVEKLQTISTKFRQQQEKKEFPLNFMRHYYDIFRLLQQPSVRDFIGSAAYKAHKAKRFRVGDNPNIAQNQAFILSQSEVRKLYRSAYEASTALYYGDKPSLDEIIDEIGVWIDRL